MIGKEKSKSAKLNLWEGILRRQRAYWLAVGLFIIAALATVLQINPKYSSQTSFELPKLAENDQHFTDQQLIGHLKNHQRVSAALMDVGIKGELAGDSKENSQRQQQLTNDLLDGISISRAKQDSQTQTIVLQVTNEDTTLIKEIPEKMITGFVEDVFKTRLDKLKKQKADLEKQRELIQAKLAKLQSEDTKEVEPKTEDKPVVESEKIDKELSELAKKINSWKAKINLLQKRKKRIENGIAELSGHNKTLQRRLASSDLESAPTEIIYGLNPEHLQVKQDITALENEILRLKKVEAMTDQHPQVQGVLVRLKSLRIKLAELPEKIIIREVVAPGINKNKIKKQIEENTKDISRLEDGLLAIDTEIKNLNLNIDVNTPATEPVRNATEIPAVVPAETKNQLIETKLSEKKKLQAENAKVTAKIASLDDILANQSQQKLTVLNSVKLENNSFTPSYPKFKIVLLVVLITAMVFAAGIVLLASAFDKTVTNKSQACKISGLPCLGEISEIVTKDQRSRRAVSWMITPMIGTVLVVVIGMLSMKLSERLSFKVQAKPIINQPANSNSGELDSHAKAQKNSLSSSSKTKE